MLRGQHRWRCDADFGKQTRSFHDGVVAPPPICKGFCERSMLSVVKEPHKKAPPPATEEALTVPAALSMTIPK